jgi:tetratricopeptide (TPR) repeat protein
MKFDQWRFTVRAVLLEWFQRPEQAIEAYQSVLKASPTDVRAMRSVAWLHARQQRWAAAAEAFKQALAQEQDHTDTWFNLGYVLEQGGDHAAAISAFSQAAQINPKHDRAWYGMGLAKAHLGDHLGAIEPLQHAAELQPMNGPAWYALGMAYHNSNQPDQVKRVAMHCLTHDIQAARRLIKEANRSDLVPLLPD